MAAPFYEIVSVAFCKARFTVEQAQDYMKTLNVPVLYSYTHQHTHMFRCSSAPVFGNPNIWGTYDMCGYTSDLKPIVTQPISGIEVARHNTVAMRNYLIYQRIRHNAEAIKS